MFPHRMRLCALLTALTLALTACSSAGPEPISSAGRTAELTADVGGQLILSFLPLMLPEPEPRPVLTQEDVDQTLDRAMQNFRAAAVSVATVEHGRLSQCGAWGWAVKGRREMTPDTKMRVASLSKVVVAMAAMAMAEDGILDLDAPLSSYWGPGVRNPYSQSQPSARTLMTHTSSVKNLDTELVISGGLARIQGLLQKPSAWRRMEPGNGGYWYYSNFGMCVLGTTMELACGGLADDYLRQRILQPLEVNASFYPGTLGEEHLADLYTPGGVGRSAAAQAKFMPPSGIGRSASCYPGGFTASARDLGKLVAVLANDGVYEQPLYEYTERSSTPEGSDVALAVIQAVENGHTETRILTEASVEAMETPYFLVDPVSASPFEQCLILRRQEDILGQDVLYYHTGSAYGAFTLITYNPDTRNGVAVLTTGTPRAMNDRGLYALCAGITEDLYRKMEEASAA